MHALPRRLALAGQGAASPRRTDTAGTQDADYLLHIAQNIQGRTICAFGEACAWPVLSFVNKFRDEFEARGAGEAKTGRRRPAAAHENLRPVRNH